MSPQALKEKLQKTYPNGVIEVTDLTGTQDHYQVYVESSQFKSLSRIEQHKAVMGVFQEEIASGEVHALSIKTGVPKEDN